MVNTDYAINPLVQLLLATNSLYIQHSRNSTSLTMYRHLTLLIHVCINIYQFKPLDVVWDPTWEGSIGCDPPSEKGVGSWDLAKDAYCRV